MGGEVAAHSRRSGTTSRAADARRAHVRLWRDDSMRPTKHAATAVNGSSPCKCGNWRRAPRSRRWRAWHLRMRRHRTRWKALRTRRHARCGPYADVDHVGAEPQSPRVRTGRRRSHSRLPSRIAGSRAAIAKPTCCPGTCANRPPLLSPGSRSGCDGNGSTLRCGPTASSHRAHPQRLAGLPHDMTVSTFYIATPRSPPSRPTATTRNRHHLPAQPRCHHDRGPLAHPYQSWCVRAPVQLRLQHPHRKPSPRLRSRQHLRSDARNPGRSASAACAGWATPRSKSLI